MNKRDQLLFVELIDGQLLFGIGVDVLKIAAEGMPDLEEFIEATGEVLQPRVTNPDDFAAAVLAVLLEEKEDGTTPVHEMLDRAILAAIEEGAEGIELPDEYAKRERRARR